MAEPHELIGFCKANEPVLCAPGNLINPPAGGYVLFLALAKEAVLSNNAAFKTEPEKCHSKVATKVTEVDKTIIPGSTTEASFTECKGPCKKAESKGLPWSGSLTMETPLGSVWSLKTTEGKALLSECAFGVSCEYGANAEHPVLLKGTNTATGASLTAENVELALLSGGTFTCGSTGTWNALYEATEAHLFNSEGKLVESHEPWWFTLLGE
jgi:hypothetical protein